MPFFPQSGGGGAGFEGYPVQYVSPSGNNSAPGTLNAPKKTLSAAYNDLASGGDIYGAPNCQWSDGTEGLGLSNGQGIWINNGTAVPGFLAQKNCTFHGWGTTTYGPFGTQVALWNIGKADGTTTRDNPGIWMVNVGVPITFSHVGVIADQAARIGWDYRRTSGLAVKNLAITNATRSAGQTVFTVTLTTSAITTFQRTSGTVRVTYTLDEAYVAAIPGSVVRINAGSQSANYPNGDYPVLAADNISPGVYFFEYLEGSGTRGPDTPTGATFGTTGFAARYPSAYGVCEITSNSNEFPATMYVGGFQSSAADQVVVRDPYGGTHGRSASANVNNIGNLRVQLRYLSTTFETFDDCVLYAGTTGGEKFGLGPTIDKGDSAGGAQWSWYRRCYLQGSVTGNALAEQEIARTSNLFMTGVNAVGAGFYDINMSEGGLYQPIAYGNCVSTYCKILQDTAIGVPIFTTLTMEVGNAVVTVDSLSIADIEAHSFAADLGSVGGAVTVINTPVTGGLGTIFLPPPVAQAGNSTSGDYWALQTKSYDQYLYNGFWGRDGRVAGKRDDVQSQFGVIQHHGISNLANTDLSTWTTAGTITVTGNQSTAGLDKADKGFKLSCTAGGAASVYNDLTTPSAVAGDKVIIGYWIKAATDTVTGVNSLMSDMVYDPAGAQIPLMTQYVPFGNDGAWDWVVDIAEVVSSMAGKTTLRFKLYVAQGHDVIVYMPQALYLANGTYSDNEIARLLRVSRTVPPYLASGQAGTMPGIKLVGESGLQAGPNAGTTPTVVMFDGASAGVSAANTGALRYNQGTNKIQYSKNGGAWTDLV